MTYGKRDGFVRFSQEPDDATYEKLCDCLLKSFEIVGEEADGIAVWSEDKFNEDSDKEVLEESAKIAEAAGIYLTDESAVEYRENDDTVYRFAYRDGNWVQQFGTLTVTYDE